MNKTIVDVVLLSWNRAKLTLETVANLLLQEEVDVKIWIVDQGSSPDDILILKEGIKHHANIHLEELGRNVGVPAGRNIGTRLGLGEIVVSIDNDAELESPTALRRVVDSFESDKQLGIIGFRIVNYFTKQDDELSWVYPKSMISQREQPFKTTRFCGCGHAFRRKVFEEAQGYDDSLFFYWEEVDFSYRVINLDYQIVYDPQFVVLHKVSPEARVRWQERRYYFLVRNAIYMNYKYNRSIKKSMVLATGYLLKGCYNGLITQSIKAIWDSIPMCRSAPSFAAMPSLVVNPKAKAYLQEHEMVFRGSLLNRLRNEVLVKLPGQ